jgi:hypothetical protein
MRFRLGCGLPAALNLSDNFGEAFEVGVFLFPGRHSTSLAMIRRVGSA